MATQVKQGYQNYLARMNQSTGKKGKSNGKKQPGVKKQSGFKK